MRREEFMSKQDIVIDDGGRERMDSIKSALIEKKLIILTATVSN